MAFYRFKESKDFVKTERSIVALGDSLTKGHYKIQGNEGVTVTYLPYTFFLQRMVGEYLRRHKKPFDVYIDNLSQDGMLVGSNSLYLDSMGGGVEISFSRVLDLSPDVCILLGGSNNLGYFLQSDSDVEHAAESIAGILFSIYDRFREAGAQPISVTVPSVLVAPEERERARFLVEGRRRLNDRIKEYSTRNGINCVDLFAATATEDGWMRGEYANDGLHFNPKGYSAMAEAIFDQGVKSILDAWLGEDNNKRGILGRMRIGR